MEIAKESQAIERARAKLAALLETQSITDTGLEATKTKIRDWIADNQPHRLFVHKETSALFANNAQPAQESATVQKIRSLCEQKRH